MSSEREHLPDTPTDDLPAVDDGGSQTRVAVDVLQRDQDAVLFGGDDDRRPPIRPLTAGFEDRQELINWWQAAAVRTFGYISDVFPAVEIVRDQALQGALVAGIETPDRIGPQQFRQDLLEYIMRACDRAFRELEQRANEWLSEDGSHSDQDWTRIDPENQRHVAMRPAFSRLDSQQARCLRMLWGGFDDSEHLTRWVHRLPAVAEFDDDLDDGIMAAIRRDPYARRMFLAGEGGQLWREQFAAIVLLPAFANRAERLQGGERPRSKPDDNPWNEV